MAWGGARPNSGPKSKRREAVPREPHQPLAAKRREPLAITDDVLLRAHARPRRTEDAAQAGSVAFNPFTPNAELHPPAARPKPEDTGLAMDEAAQVISVNATWAGNAMASAWAEGVTFLGYPYLAELAQRPEYRVISETIATEMTRKWIRLQAKGGPEGVDKTDKINQLGDELDRIKAQDTFRQAAEQDGFFGRSHIYIDTGATDNRPELLTPIGDGWNEISKAKVGKGSLQRIGTVEAVWTYPTQYNSNDPLKPDWYKPSNWFVQGKEMHASRLLTFVGREVPDLLKPAYSFGGLSLSQMAKPYVDNWLRTRQSVADLIHAFSVFALSTDLQETLMNGGDQLFRRISLFNLLRDNRGLMALNKETEELDNISAPLGTLDALQAQTQEHMAAVSRIPLVKLLGIQPAGLNASSEGEIRTFYDTIAAYQKKLFADNLRRVMGFCMLSLWGEVDPDITFEFESLWALDEKGEAEVRKIDAETGQILTAGGVIHPEEERQRVAAAPDTPYHSLDVDDLPEPPQTDPNDEDGGADPDGDGSGEEPGGAQDEFREADHPRGQPSNPGQFGPGGGGGGAPKGKAKKNDGLKSFSARENGQTVEIRAPDQETAMRLMQARADQLQANERLVAKGERPKPLPTLETLTGAAPAPGKPNREAEPPKANASTLYTPAAKTADQIVAGFPGGAEAIVKTRARIAAGIPTDKPVSVGGFKTEDGTYTPERQAIHNKIVDAIFTPEHIAAATPAPGEKPVLTMLGGRGGSGKSWFTGEKGPVDASKAMLLDSDAIKAQLPGFEGWNAALYHDESTDVLALADRRALSLGLNTIHDATLKTETSAVLRMAQYEAAGYEVEGYYMYLSPEEAAGRAMNRFSKKGTFTGRFVPPEIILGMKDNEKNFDKLSQGMKKWAVYDNSTTAERQDPRLVSKSG